MEVNVLFSYSSHWELWVPAPQLCVWISASLSLRSQCGAQPLLTDSVGRRRDTGLGVGAVIH